MGILLSFLFPRQFMPTEQPTSASSSTRSTASVHTAEPDISPPSSPCSTRSQSLPPDPSLPSNNTQTDLPSRETRSYMPHVVGLGILSPRSSIGTLSQLHHDPVLSPSMRGSPTVQRHSSFDSTLQQLASANVFPGSPQHRATNPFEGVQAVPPQSPSLAYAEASAANATLCSKPSSPGAQRPPSPGANVIGLHVSMPSLHHPGNPFVHGVVSPPVDAVISPPIQLGESQMPTAPTSTNPDFGEEIPYPQTNPVDTALNVEFAEFDSEGLSALEKIYLFSRSRASFQRVFIAHALPGFLRAASVNRTHQTRQPEDGVDANQLQDDVTEADVITPAEAVEYVLPLLNGLAMDEDETVKEALAAELVPVIWWFITHCKLVEDDPSSLPVSPSSQPEPTDGGNHPIRISVQAFTPILGTLLLSPNGMVGGPARFAVVELLNRVRRANEKENSEPVHLRLHLPTREDEYQEINREEDRGGTSALCYGPHDGGEGDVTLDESEDGNYSPIGLFGSAERDMFEREMVQQVVIGMGRLDLLDDGMYGSEEDLGEIADTTAMPTPHAIFGQAQVVPDSYFPFIPLSAAAEPQPADIEPPGQLPPLTVDSTASAAGPDFAALSSPAVLSPVASPAVSPAVSPAASPAVSPASDPSTPSLTSTSSSASSTTSETITPTTPPAAIPSELSPGAATSYPLPPSPSLGDHAQLRHEDWTPLSPRHPSLALLSPRLSISHYPPSPPRPTPLSPVQLIARPPTPPPPFAASLPSLSSDRLTPNEEEPGILSPRPQPASVLPDLINGETQVDAEEQPEEEDEERELTEEASVGRLSSMSLMAAVAASGSISDETKAAFVQEVERVGRDPVYWVRREACFAVGALSKVVPQEVVLSTLLPLFEDLCRDDTWHVRHSALFALPAILSRLIPDQRRMLALSVLLPLAHDEAATVRAGVLEALAEVIHTFHEDPQGPPDELVRLFLGIREDDDPLKAQQTERAASPKTDPNQPMSWSDFMASVTASKEQDIYDDPSRPLVCAFNYPAVALTLGRDRWLELRDLYIELSQNASFKVRRTLAASLGEMAKIIGPEHSQRDLLNVWWSSASSEESEVRLKAMECLELFVDQLAPQDRAEVIRGLDEKIWSVLKGWRERETVMSIMRALVNTEGVEPGVLRRLLRKGLVDTVATVREAAISSLSTFISSWASHPVLLEELWNSLHRLGTSSSYRERMAFVACYQEILLSNVQHSTFFSDTVLGILTELACDRIVDVRIRLARLLGVIRDMASNLPDSVSRTILHLAQQLMYDDSHDVRAFAEPVAKQWPTQARTKVSTDVAKSSANFSRPPPLASRPS